MECVQAQPKNILRDILKHTGKLKMAEYLQSTERINGSRLD